MLSPQVKIHTALGLLYYDYISYSFRTILGAFCYSVYIVLLRRRVNHEDNMDSPMFFGFVGMFNAFMLWPGIIGLHFSGKETFEVSKPL